MAPVTNTRVIFNEYPDGYPDPKRTLVLAKSEIDLDEEPLNGGILVKVLALSVDPYLRGLMGKDGTYRVGGDAFVIGEPIFSGGVSKVVRSEDPQFSVGDCLHGIHPFVEYAVLNDLEGYRKIEYRERLPWSAYLGVCGMPGRTAHHGYMEYIKPYAKKGDTIFITTGAGPVGSFLIQLAKRDGLKVVASAGSEEKVKFMKECGADVPFNYKTTSTSLVLAQHGPINFYWDHVGGDALDCALEACANFGRIIICGLISGYNEPPKPVRNFTHVLCKNLTISGFLYTSLAEKYESEFWKSIPPQVATGKLKHREDIRHGLESVGKALLDVQMGRNMGKAIVMLEDD